MWRERDERSADEEKAINPGASIIIISFGGEGGKRRGRKGKKDQGRAMKQNELFVICAMPIDRTLIIDTLHKEGERERSLPNIAKINVIFTMNI